MPGVAHMAKWLCKKNENHRAHKKLQTDNKQKSSSHCPQRGWGKGETEQDSNMGKSRAFQGLLRSGSCSKVLLILDEECLIDGVHYKYGGIFSLALGAGRYDLDGSASSC